MFRRQAGRQAARQARLVPPPPPWPPSPPSLWSTQICGAILGSSFLYGTIPNAGASPLGSNHIGLSGAAALRAAS